MTVFGMRLSMPALVPAIFVLTVAFAGGARLIGYQPGYEPAATLASRELRFTDRDDGGIMVTDATTGESAGLVAQGGDGFLRATMRGLANARKQGGHGPDIPFVLSSHADGALILRDPVTGRSLDLAAFGPTNEAAFARFLPAARPGTKTAAL